MKQTSLFTGALLLLLVVLSAMGWSLKNQREAATGLSLFSSKKSSFSRKRSGSSFTIRKTFKDLNKRKVLLSFDIKQSDVQRLNSSFGVHPGIINNKIAAMMSDAVNRSIAQKGLSITVTVTPGKTGVTWKYRYTYRNTSEKKRLLTFAASLKDYYRDAAKRCYRDRGFIMRGRNVTPDYSRLAVTHEKPLRPVFRSLSLYRSANNYSRRDFAELILSFCQDIPYENIPLKDDKARIIAGLYPPVKTVVENRGDCDCKALLFTTLWRNISPSGSLLIHIPGHMFAAVEGRPLFSSELSLTYKGKSYIVIEPVGPGRYPLGRISPSSYRALKAGNFTIIEPKS